MEQEFNNLLMAFSLLDKSHKKIKLLDVIKQNVELSGQLLKKANKSVLHAGEDILNSLNLSDEEELILYMYILLIYLQDNINGLIID